MKKEYRAIEGFPNYFVTNTGEIYRQKNGKLFEVKNRVDTKGNYLLVYIKNFDGVWKTCLVHRLVAKAFIPNPGNLPEVNHKDKNKQNNNVGNLNWCTRRENLEDSYKTMSPNRNFRTCKLYKSNQLIGEFDGVKRAAEAAAEQFGASFYSLSKYLKWLDIEIKVDNMTGKYSYEGHLQQRTQNRQNINVISPDGEVFTFQKWNDVVIFFQSLGIQHTDSYYRQYICNKDKFVNGYKIIR